MEKYLWVIEFLDGTKIQERNTDGTFNKLNFEELNKRKPFVFHLCPTDDKLLKITALIDGDKRLIFIKRRVGKMSLSSGDSGIIKTYYAVGWQCTVEGKNVKNILWVDPEDNKVYNCDDLNLSTGA